MARVRSKAQKRVHAFVCGAQGKKNKGRTRQHVRRQTANRCLCLFLCVCVPAALLVSCSVFFFAFCVCV